MEEIDRAMIQDYRIELIQMMENAGRNLAHLARSRFLDGNPTGKNVVVLAGPGGNGGGALVAARHLHNWGAQVQVNTSHPGEAFKPVPAHQLDILRRMKLPIEQAGITRNIRKPDLVIDGLIGYSLKGVPRGTVAEMIRWANGIPVPILSLDVPSGIDATTGTIFDPAIHASATLTLALPKEGLRASVVQLLTGELYLADISVPPELYEQVVTGLKVGALFAERDIIRLW